MHESKYIHAEIITLYQQYLQILYQIKIYWEIHPKYLLQSAGEPNSENILNIF